ncbi:hypothetical protein TNCV_4800991 [Trichonephila clavipes]|nr:hypothetical protein TNCV_4800991 [Trichonephila clavipes]
MTISNKVLLYTAVLWPILSYASPVWGYAADSNIKILEIAQKSLIRSIVKPGRYESSDDRTDTGRPRSQRRYPFGNRSPYISATPNKRAPSRNARKEPHNTSRLAATSLVRQPNNPRPLLADGQPIESLLTRFCQPIPVLLLQISVPAGGRWTSLGTGTRSVPPSHT